VKGSPSLAAKLGYGALGGAGHFLRRIRLVGFEQDLAERMTITGMNDVFSPKFFPPAVGQAAILRGRYLRPYCPDRDAQSPHPCYSWPRALI